MPYYNIPQYAPIELLSTAESLAIGRIYGIGISRAIARQAAGKDRGQSPYSASSESNPYLDPNSPDATRNKDGSYDRTKTARWDGMMSSSLSGMPVMCALKLVGGNYVDLQGRNQTIPDVTFENVLMTVTINKNIEVTDIQGRDSGSVKEHIGLGDYGVEIRAIVTSDAPVNSSIQKRNQDGVYPRDNMEAINRVLIAPISIPVVCWYLQMFNINHIVVTQGIQVQQVEGEYSMQRLIIPALSDNPLIIKIAR